MPSILIKRDSGRPSGKIRNVRSRKKGLRESRPDSSVPAGSFVAYLEAVIEDPAKL